VCPFTLKEGTDMFSYYVTIGTNGITSNEPGKIYLDNFLEIIEKDLVESCTNHMYNLLQEDEDKKIKNGYAAEIGAALKMIKLRANVQQTTLLKFTSEFQISREEMDSYIKITPLKELLNARISR
jgi:hypothetical protein